MSTFPPNGPRSGIGVGLGRGRSAEPVDLGAVFEPAVEPLPWSLRFAGALDRFTDTLERATGLEVDPVTPDKVPNRR